MNTSVDTPLPCPSLDDADAAPQLLVVSLAHAALAAVDRALDSAHPILAAIAPSNRSPPPLLTTEHLAALLLHESAALASLLRDYDLAVRAEIHDFDSGHRSDLDCPF